MVYVNMVNIGKYTASIINALQQQSSAYVMIIAELLARAKRAQSGAPWVRKFGKLSI